MPAASEVDAPVGRIDYMNLMELNIFAFDEEHQHAGARQHPDRPFAVLRVAGENVDALAGGAKVIPRRLVRVDSVDESTTVSIDNTRTGDADVAGADGPDQGGGTVLG